jgi:hypothetical protein
LICEVGAGKSVLSEILDDLSNTAKAVYITDSSEKMLKHSDQFIGENIIKKVIAADSIYNLRVKFDIVVASLGDPYNDSAFWEACFATLNFGGECYFTTPSYEWASQFRENAPTERKDHAMFMRKDGSIHYVPSLIYSQQSQVELINSTGLVFRDYECLGSGSLIEVPPKISTIKETEPVVCLYAALKKSPC